MSPVNIITKLAKYVLVFPIRTIMEVTLICPVISVTPVIDEIIQTKLN